MKLLFLIADGMGDRPCPALGGKTPMEAAPTPHMDALAAAGLVGTCRTVPPGMPPGSDVANMSLLGFDPAAHHTGRGPIEAAAQGLALDPDDLVFRCNLVNLTGLDADGVMLDYSSGHIATEAAAPIIQELQEQLGGPDWRFHLGVQYRHLLVKKGGASSPEANLFVNPPHDITDKPIAPDLKAMAACPDIWRLVREAYGILASIPHGTRARSIWPWGQGRPLHLPDFRQTFGLAGAVISAVDLVRGLGRACGMEVIEAPGATGLLDTNYEGKAEAALEFLSRGDFVFVHLEGPDECGHGGDAAAKTEAVRRFDERIVGRLRRELTGQDAAFLVTCDHLTPLEVRTHTPEPVPFLLHYPGCPASGVPAFSEAAAETTGLRLERGHELLPWALERIGRR